MVWVIWVAVSIALALAWKLRWAVIRPTSSSAISTLRALQRARQQLAVQAGRPARHSWRRRKGRSACQFDEPTCRRPVGAMKAGQRHLADHIARCHRHRRQRSCRRRATVTPAKSEPAPLVSGICASTGVVEVAAPAASVGKTCSRLFEAVLDEARFVQREAAVAGVIGLAGDGGTGGEEAVAGDRQIQRRAGLLDRAEREVLADRLHRRADALDQLRIGKGRPGHDVAKFDAALLETAGFGIGDIVGDHAEIGLGVLAGR